MLIRFSVENCFSFLERATFSMIPGLGRLKKEHINAREHSVSTLKTAIAFGANASGKSNLVKAIALGRQMILLGSLNGPKVTFSPYRLSKDASIEILVWNMRFKRGAKTMRKMNMGRNFTR